MGKSLGLAQEKREAVETQFSNAQVNRKQEIRNEHEHQYGVTVR